MSRIISLIKFALTSHYQILHSQFYIISPHVSSSYPAHNNRHFYFIFSIYLLTLSYGILYMPYIATGQIIQWDDLFTNKHTFTYQMLPPLIANQFAAANDLSIGVSFLLIICLWRAPKVAAEFRLLPQAGGELFSIGQTLLLDRAQSLKILKCFQFVKFAYYSLLLPTYFNLLAFFFVGLWLNNSYSVNLGSIIFWCVLNPLMTFYLVYGN